MEDDSKCDAEECDRPPLQSAHSKAGVTWKYEKEEIKRDSFTAHDPEPRFMCVQSTITSIPILFIYLLPRALTTEAEDYTNAQIADANQHTSVPELLMLYGYLIIITKYDTRPINQLWNVTGPENDCMQPPNIGRHGMSLKGFRFLLSHWRCGPKPQPRRGPTGGRASGGSSTALTSTSPGASPLPTCSPSMSPWSPGVGSICRISCSCRASPSRLASRSRRSRASSRGS
jgi:hypothetical protein